MLQPDKYLENYKQLQSIYKNRLPKDIVLTKGICLAAVKQKGGYALKYVPEPLRDRDMCLAAVSQYGGAISYVPEPLRIEIKRELGL